MLLTSVFPLIIQFSSVAQSCDSLRPHGLQHARPPCPSPTPGVYPNSCPLSQWCHPTISSSVIPFSHLQSFAASGSFPVSQLFASGGQSIGVSASTSVLLMNIQDWFPLGWTYWISLQSKGLLRVFSNTTVQKHQFFSAQLSLKSKSQIHTWLLRSIHDYWKNHSLPWPYNLFFYVENIRTLILHPCLKSLDISKRWYLSFLSWVSIHVLLWQRFCSSWFDRKKIVLSQNTHDSYLCGNYCELAKQLS